MREAELPPPYTGADVDDDEELEDEDDEEGEDSYDDRVNRVEDPPDEEVHPFELDVDHEEVEVPPAIARRLAEAPVPAIVIPPLKSKDAIASMAKRGQQTGELERRLSPWERPREGFSSAMGVKHGESPLGPGWAGKRADKV